MEKQVNIFEGAKFGDKFITRGGEPAVYLSTERGGSEDDKDNPPFLIIWIAVEHYVKYTDGTDKRFHGVYAYHESGKYNKWNPEDDELDIVGRIE